MGSNIEASLSNYSKTIAFIRVEHAGDYVVIPNDVITAIESMQHVKKLYKVYMFSMSVVERNVSVILDGIPSVIPIMFLANPTTVLGLGELPPFILDIRSGRLPLNGTEIALVSGGNGDYYKVGQDIEVAFNSNETTITKVRISGLLTRSLLSPAQMIVHKDFLLSAPCWKDILDEALKGKSTALFVEVDDIYNVGEVLENIRELLKGKEFLIICDEYQLKKTLELSGRGALSVRLLSFGALSFSAILIMLASYLSVNFRKWEVGLLRSLGFSNREIMVAYLLYSLALAVFGAAAAFLVAYAMGPSIENLMFNALNLGGTVSATALELTPITALLALMLATSISAASILITNGIVLRKTIEEQLREF